MTRPPPRRWSWLARGATTACPAFPGGNERMDVMDSYRTLSRSKLCALFLAAACAAPLAGCVGDLTDEEVPTAIESTVTTSPTTLVRKGSDKCLDVNGSST